MSEKKLNARIVHKHDVEANWLKATSFIPKQGEIIVYDIDANYTYERFKIGDGKTVVSALPFADDTKVDKISGKGLSTNDYTTTEKNKLAGIATGANKTVVDSSLSTSSTNPVQNKVVSAAINNLSTLVGDESVSTQISTAIANKADSGHTHDDRYYTESEVDSKLSEKSDADHTHSAYVNQNAFSKVAIGSTTIEADNATDTLTLVAGNNVTLTPDASGDKVTIAATNTVYTHPSSGVTAGTYKSVTVNAQGHVTSGSNPTTLSGYGITDAAAKSHNHSNATTSASGFMSSDDKAALDEVVNLVGGEEVSSQINSAIATKADKDHTHAIADVNGLQAALDGKETSGAADSALTSAKSYTDTKISALINSAPTTLDTLGEIATAMEENADVVAALEAAIGTKADSNHTHSYAGSSSAGGAATSANKLNTNAGSATQPVYFANGVPVKTTYTLGASVPSDAKFTDTTYSVATQSANGLMSAADKKILDTLDEYVGDSSVSSQISSAIASKADSNHTHSSYVNQNAFSNVAVGTTTIAADSTTDTLTVVAGSNITITPDATNDKITIAATDTVYTHPSYTSKSSGLYKVTVDSTGHVSGTTAVKKSDITALGIPAQDTTYSSATTSAAGLMSAADKTKLDGIATGATKITVDSSLSSSSTNPVQNKAVNVAISNLNTLVGDTSVSTQISDAVDECITGLSVSGKTITYTKGDGTTGTITTQDTNTTYSAATTSADGLMSATDKAKLNYTNIAYGTCSTAAATAAKVIAVSGNTNWTLTAGSMITVLFSATNTASNPTFNVNGTGAKNVYYTSSQITTSSLSYAGYANRPMTFMYDGTQYRFIGWGIDNNSDTKVQQNAAITTAGEYPVILAYSTATSKVTNAVQKTSTLTYNPSTKILTAPTFNGNLTGNADTATSATSATSATKATQDASGNVITSTYATKTELATVSNLVGDTAVSTQITNAIATKADKTELPQIATAESSDGVAFTVTVPGITALAAGMSFVMIPSRASASTTPTLNVNGLGAKNLRRRLSSGATVVAGYTTTWITKNKPYRVMYDGSAWVVEGHNKPVAADLYGSVLPKVASATLTAANWTGTESPYSQTVVISGTTANSKIDLQPTVAQIVELQTAGTALMTENNSGTITVYAIGEKPTSDYTIQVTITETTT